MNSVMIRDTIRTLFAGLTIPEGRRAVNAGRKASSCERDAGAVSNATIPSLCCGNPTAIVSLAFFRPLVR
jgi:hypothetical protein